MDRVLSENSVSSFDFVDLTLILRDLAEPVKKLRSVVERVSTNGVVYVRELDHHIALAYPDQEDLFQTMFSLIRKDKYSGDYEAGRKVYNWMRNADLEDIHFEAHQLSTVGMSRREKRTLFDALFSYLPREYEVLYREDPTSENKVAVDWLRENYDVMERTFSSDDFFYSSGFMEFYGYVR